jgi:hypothetical protein
MMPLDGQTLMMLMTLYARCRHCRHTPMPPDYAASATLIAPLTLLPITDITLIASERIH